MVKTDRLAADYRANRFIAKIEGHRGPPVCVPRQVGKGRGRAYEHMGKVVDDLSIQRSARFGGITLKVGR